MQLLQIMLCFQLTLLHAIQLPCVCRKKHDSLQLAGAKQQQVQHQRAQHQHEQIVHGAVAAAAAMSGATLLCVIARALAPHWLRSAPLARHYRRPKVGRKD